MADAAIGGKQDVGLAASLFDQRPRLDQPRAGLFGQALPLDADGGAKQRHEGHVREERNDSGKRRLQPQHDAGLGAELMRQLYCAQTRFAILGVDGDEVGAGFDELARLRLDDFGLDHQVHMDRLGRQHGDARDHVGEEQEAGGEARIRHVDMMHICMGFNALKVALHIGEIRRP